MELVEGPTLADRIAPLSRRYNPDMSLDDYKVVLYRQDDGGWVAEVPAIAGCYALMATRGEALEELERVFALILEESQERGQALPVDSTEILHA